MNESTSNESIRCDENSPLLRQQSSSADTSTSSESTEISKNSQCLSLELVAVTLCFGWAVSGYFITYVSKATICHLSDSVNLSPWLYVAAYVPAAICGGTTVVCAGLFSFLTDITTEKNRTVRMGILQACTLAGAFLGMMSSSFILAWANATTAFLISAGMMLFSVGYVNFVIVDSVSLRTAASGSCAKLREIFRLDLLRDMFNTFFKARFGYDRGIIWLTVAIAGFTVLGSRGGDIMYLYTRKEFNWTLEDYTLWQSIDLLSFIVGNFVGIMILKKLFNLPDIAIAFLSVLCLMSDSFIKGMATHGWQFYMATGITPLKGTEGAALMAISSSILPSHDIAKIYSMAMSLSAMVPLAGSPLFTYIYSQTLTTKPAVFNFVASAIFSVNLLLVGIIHRLLKKRQKHRRLSDDSTQSETAGDFAATDDDYHDDDEVIA
ncbi:uncharacterized protein LOC129719449 isoform X2 [Wyeomyia smithii]|uniref:uncharacterized protein LOC129719449 isoform X2 n=1 Tax=Wyeomyia smithii TaxID=174621 RepID=UPI002467CEB8|nr:uncharacterized protein LOC129719449 isoform X2 [Wyeomyia smithii]